MKKNQRQSSAMGQERSVRTILHTKGFKHTGAQCKSRIPTRTQTFKYVHKRPPKLLRLKRSGNVCWRFHCHVIGDSIDSISTHIQNVLQQLQNWARCNCMSIHPVKTESMFASDMPFIGPILPITLENNLINCVSHSLRLGVTSGNKLNRE